MGKHDRGDGWSVMGSDQFQIIPNIYTHDGVVRLKCERDKLLHDYDFNFIPNDEWRERFIECFVSKKSEMKVHRSRYIFITHIKKLFESLEACQFSSSLRDIDQSVLDNFIVYLHNCGLSESQRSKYCSTGLRALRRINALHDDSYFSIDIPSNPFVGTTEAIERSTSYSAEEFDHILEALGKALENNSIITFNKKWLDKNKFLVGDFSELEFRECYYANYYRTGKTIKSINLPEDDVIVRGYFYKWSRQYHGSSKAFYDLIDPDIESYKRKYAGRELVHFRLAAPEVFQIFLFVAIASGFNKQTLLDMEIDRWLVPHPFIPEVSIVQAPKFRSKKMYLSSFAESNDAIIQLLKKYERICELVIGEDNDFSKFWRIGYYNPAELLSTTVDKQNKDFVRIYGLKDKIGTSSIHFRKIRATAAEQMLVRFKGDFTKLKQFLNHEKSETTYDYVEQCLDNRHIQEELSKKVDMMTCAFMNLKNDSEREHLKDHLNVNDRTADSIIAGYFDTPYARCKNPFIGTGSAASEDNLCKNFDLLKCLVCNSVVVFPEDLYKLFSYVYLKNNQLQAGLITLETYNFYVPIINFIESTLASRFDESVVQAMRTKAKEDPYYVYS